MSIYTNLINSGADYAIQVSGVYASETTQTYIVPAKTVSNIYWNINGTNGESIELLWEGSSGNPDIPFAILSGNGRWDLGKAKFIAPTTSTGNIKLTYLTFSAGDTFTIIIYGQK